MQPVLSLSNSVAFAYSVPAQQQQRQPPSLHVPCNSVQARRRVARIAVRPSVVLVRAQPRRLQLLLLPAAAAPLLLLLLLLCLNSG